MKFKKISPQLKKNYFKLISLSSLLLITSCSTEESISDLNSTNQNNLSSSSVELPVSNTIADEEQSANPAINATDSDPESRWSGFGSSVNLDLDLGSVSLIDYVNIAYHKGDERVSSFQAYTSTNNRDWTLVGTKNSSGSTENLETFDLTNTNGRYLRLTCTGNSLNDWNSILDIEVYGTPGDDEGTTTNTYTSIPSKIEAEDFDAATEGRTQVQGSVTNVGWIDSGESLSYNINVPSSGTYDIDFRVASRFNGTSFDIYQGNSRIGIVFSDATGGWAKWETITATVNLSSGNQTLHIIASGSGWNIDWLQVKKSDDDNSNEEEEEEETPSTDLSGTFNLEDFQIETSWLSGENSTSTTSFTATSKDNEDWYDKVGNTYWLKSLETDGNRTEWKEYPGKEASLSTYKKMEYKAIVEDIPENGVTIAQVHNRGGVNRPLLRVYIDDDRYIKIKVTSTDPSASSSSYDVYEGPFYREGTDFTVRVLTQSGRVSINVITTNGSMSETITPSGDWDDWDDSYYLKAGVYTEGDDTNPKITFDYFVVDK